MNKRFAYIRVSDKTQNENRQLDEMLQQNIEERDIFIDKASGKNFNRPKYQALKQMLRAGDVLYIKSIDRFGRNKDDILKEWNEITKEIGADIVVLDMPLLDTRQYKDVLGSFVSDLVLQILSFFAEEERRKIKERQREGIDAAQRRGAKFGRPAATFPPGFEEVYKRWKDGEIKAIEAMEELELKRTTFYKLIQKFESQKSKNAKF
ncbi:recombinase family protein [Bacillus paranthracis]|uniref:recombinase family protein n=1 Tax=Bacillus paranthracis TaxID=2026186 RepID=UPI001E543247|nr:recombinase family protein [Bacillus paranthracis]MCC2430678.1 recombinase family protein [Bacillus paranthracis]